MENQSFCGFFYSYAGTAKGLISSPIFVDYGTSISSSVAVESAKNVRSLSDLLLERTKADVFELNETNNTYGRKDICNAGTQCADWLSRIGDEAVPLGGAGNAPAP